MAKYSSDNPNRIVRIDGNGTFLEALADSFNIDKVKLTFSQYDKISNKTTQRIDCYLNFGTMLYLCDFLTHGEIGTEIYQRQEAVLADKSLKLELHTVWENSYMGTSSARANRPDNKAEHRSMSITLGNKILIKAESGPGKELGKGQITKDYQRPEKSISVNVDVQEFYAFLYTIKAHIEGYVGSLYPYKSGRYMYNSQTQTYEPYDADVARVRYESRQQTTPQASEISAPHTKNPFAKRVG